MDKDDKKKKSNKYLLKIIKVLYSWSFLMGLKFLILLTGGSTLVQFSFSSLLIKYLLSKRKKNIIVCKK